MKTYIAPLFSIAFACLLFVGCASTPKQDRAEASRVFIHPMASVHQAAADALVVTGFDISKSEPAYLEGTRPRKLGFIVGSGGETIGVWLRELGMDRVEVVVETAKSFAGYAGQKNWGETILAEMSATLQ